MHLLLTLLHAIYSASGRSWAAVLLTIGALALLVAGADIMDNDWQLPDRSEKHRKFFTALGVGCIAILLAAAVMNWARWRFVLGTTIAALGGIGLLSLVLFSLSVVLGKEPADPSPNVGVALRVVFGPVPLFIGIRLIRWQRRLDAENAAAERGG